MIEELGKCIEGEKLQDLSPRPWDEFVNQQVLPEVEGLDRAIVDSEVVIERKTDQPAPLPDCESDNDLPLPEQSRDIQP